MTNEQLYILLSTLADALEREIDDLREQLPSDMERYHEWWKDDSKLTGFSLPYPGEKLEVDGYEQRPTGDFVALDGLHDLVERMRDHAATLLGPRKAFHLPPIQMEYNVK